MMFTAPLCAQSSISTFATQTDKYKDTVLITYTFDHPEVEPTHFDFVLNASGKGTYHARYLETSLQVGQPVTFQKSIQIAPATIQRIIAKIVALDYLKGNYDYTKQRIAFTGKKTIKYKDNTHQGSTTLNWSENKDVMELVDTFQGIQTTLELGRRLEYLHRHQKLGLFDEMNHAEDTAKSGWLREIYLISDILQKLYDDPKVIQTVRNGAKRLMDRAIKVP